MVVPFIGAGLASTAGAPSVDDLAAALAARAGVADGSLQEVSTAATNTIGELATNAAVADIINSARISPTPTLTALSTWPAQRLLTTNYCRAIEDAAELAGLQAVPVAARVAKALRPPLPGTIKVVHLHGSAADPPSIVLPGRPTQLLTADDVFRTNVRALMQQSVVIYLGFSLGPEEFPLRDSVAWLTSIPDVALHILVIPADRAAERGAELEALKGIEHVEVVTYDATRGHGYVHTVALALARTANATGRTASLLAAAVPPAYVLPALVGEDPGASLEQLESKVLGAEHGWGEAFVASDELVVAGRAVVLAAPGMGKTELARLLAREPKHSPSLLGSMRDLATALDDDAEEPARAVAQTLARGQAGVDETPAVDLAALDQTSYLFLLDDLDELSSAKRLASVQAVAAAVERWPQHRWVVVSRPTPEVQTLQAVGFSSYRILPSQAWGEAYLRARGISSDQETWLRDHRPGFGAVLGIPLFAAGIADRLQRAQQLAGDLPATALELLVEIQREATEREARETGRDAQDLGVWLGRLAVGLELRGRTDADVTELATVPGSGDLEPLAIRERLVQASLLAELPGRASFARRTMQEALCAWAILRTSEPAEALRRVAVAEVLGEQHLRDDMDFTIDLVFETASRDVRRQLLDLDEQRWARTVLGNGTVEDGREALRRLLEHHERRSVRLGSFVQGLRSPRQAAVSIASRWPILVDERRSELLLTLTQEPAYRRFNALSLLSATQANDADVWLPALIGDPAEDVAALAVGVAADWGVQAAIPALYEAAATAGRRDRRRVFHALIELEADPEEVLARAAMHPDRTVNFAEIADRLERRLTLDTAIAFLERRTHDSLLWGWFLARTLERVDAADWTDDRVSHLVTAVINHNGDPNATRDPRLHDVIDDHLDAALQAANEALLRRPPAINGLTMFASVDPVHLDRDENTAIRQGLQHAKDASETWHRPVPIDWNARTLERLDDHAANPHEVLDWQARWPVDTFDDNQRTRLTTLVRENWPSSRTLHRLDRVRSPRQVDLALGAINAAAALRLPLPASRWLLLLKIGPQLARFNVGAAFPWLSSTYRPALDPKILDLISSADSKMLSCVLAAVPNDADHLVDAVINRLDAITDTDPWWANTVGVLSDRDHVELLRRLRNGNRTPWQAAMLAERLARHGDSDAQLDVLTGLIESIDQDLRHRDQPHWKTGTSDPRVAERLGDLVVALGPEHTDTPPWRFAVGQLGIAQTDHALTVLDRLVEQLDEATFIAGTRDMLAGRLASHAVLARLPSTLADAAILLEA